MLNEASLSFSPSFLSSMAAWWLKHSGLPHSWPVPLQLPLFSVKLGSGTASHSSFSLAWFQTCGYVKGALIIFCCITKRALIKKKVPRMLCKRNGSESISSIIAIQELRILQGEGPLQLSKILDSISTEPLPSSMMLLLLASLSENKGNLLLLLKLNGDLLMIPWLYNVKQCLQVFS